VDAALDAAADAASAEADSDAAVDASMDAGLDGPAAEVTDAVAGGLVGHWRLDETSGTLASDSSGHGNHGTLTAYTTPSWQAGTIAGALGFDGEDNWVRVPASPSIEAVSSAGVFTIAAWVRPSAAVPLWSGILSRQAGRNSNEIYGLTLFDGRPAVVVNSAQPGTHLCVAAAALALGRWTHVAATYDGATGRLYVDGNLVCSLSRVVTFAPDTTPLVLGGNINRPTEQADELFEGLLDEVLLYKRALLDAEIVGLAGGGAPPP
jgi:hypothetical protein